MTTDDPFGPLRSYEDSRLGIREMFLVPFVSGAETVAVLSVPLEQMLPCGWIICHSFGMEQLYLQPLEVEVARRLASAGFPVLRFHAQGYGDSALPTDRASFRSQVEGAIQAANLLMESTGVSEIGFLGARLGATVAALAAEQIDASSLVLWEPVIDGRRYVEALLRSGAVTELASRGREHGEGDLAQQLHQTGIVDVDGFPLRRAVVEEMSGIDLHREISRFSGSSLVVQVSRSGAERDDLRRLTGRLASVGGRASLQIVTDPLARMFGLQRYHSSSGRKADTQGDLSEALISRTLAWCLEGLAPDSIRRQEGA